MTITPEKIQEEVKDIVEATTEVSITDQEQFEFFADVLQRIKGKTKELDEKRKDITRPIDSSKKKIMDMFKKPMEVLAKAEILIKTEIAKYAITVPTYEPVNGVSIRHGKKMVSYDIKKLPKEFVQTVVNEAAIQAAINAGVTIPGVEVKSVLTVVSSSKTEE